MLVPTSRETDTTLHHRSDVSSTLRPFLLVAEAAVFMLVDRHGDGASALLQMMNDHCNQASFFPSESIGMAQSGIDHWLRCWRSSGSALIVVNAGWSCCSRCCANRTTSPAWLSCAIFNHTSTASQNCHATKLPALPCESADGRWGNSGLFSCGATRSRNGYAHGHTHTMSACCCTGGCGRRL